MDEGPDIARFAEERLAEDKAAAEGLLFACRNPALKPDFTGCGGPAAEAFWDRFTPRRMLDDAEAARVLLAEITARPHDYNDGDPWFSCAQAVYPDWPGRSQEPGSGCADDDRAGGPCDCGRDAWVDRMLRLIAVRWEGDVGYKPEWKPEG